MQPTFSGERGQDPAAFIRAIQTIAFAQGRQRDNDWQADYAATCLAGPAMQWYCSLRDEERSSWSDLRRALLQRFSASLVPTSPPAAAPVFAAMPRGPEAPAARPPLYTALKENATPRPPAIGRVTENKVPTSKSPILFCGSTQPFFGFTNLSPHEVQYRGKTYYTAEHLFQAFKFMDDRPAMAEYAEYIRTVGRDPREAVSEALRFSSVVRTDWPDMDEVITLKFSQHPTLREELLATGGAELIFNSGADDEFWGNGADGRGRNELGKALMRLRSELVHVI
ncbi:hypothetical protein FRB93_002989 [Tulasnella sp. JGI-2019a]|nr:hypothetical protein FRB93_002989 [Tulasnella sp. JGI-2019a]